MRRAFSFLKCLTTSTTQVIETHAPTHGMRQTTSAEEQTIAEKAFLPIYKQSDGPDRQVTVKAWCEDHL